VIRHVHLRFGFAAAALAAFLCAGGSSFAQEAAQGAATAPAVPTQNAAQGAASALPTSAAAGATPIPATVQQPAASGAADSGAAISAAPAGAKSLTIDEAVAEGLTRDPGVRAGTWDLLSARARAADAKFRMLPSLSVSAGYTQLNPEPAPPITPEELAAMPWLPMLMQEFTGAPNNERDIRMDLQYPIFAGFRLREAAEIAKLQSLGKADGLELAKRALTFEIRRAYWEAVRATANAASLGKSLELEHIIREETKSLVEQGMATTADQLDEDARLDQTSLALDDAQSMRDMAFLSLASLIGDENAEKSVDTSAYVLASTPSEAVIPALAGAPKNTEKLIEEALANRPEYRAATVALNASLHARTAAKGDLMPAVLLNGSLAYIDPDQRAFPPTDAFSLTWAVGIRVKYDIGGVPGALERSKAAEADIEKAQADLERQRNAIALDVRRCVLALGRARTSLDLTKGMVAQARENLRVTQARYDNGLAKRSELVQSQIGVLRANFAVENKLIDVDIAQDDLARAVALEPVK
jgi:outer membrane protein TolC